MGNQHHLITESIILTLPKKRSSTYPSSSLSKRKFKLLNPVSSPTTAGKTLGIFKTIPCPASPTPDRQSALRVCAVTGCCQSAFGLRFRAFFSFVLSCRLLEREESEGREKSIAGPRSLVSGKALVIWGEAGGCRG